MYKVTFLIDERAPVTADADEGETLFELANKNNIAINAPCNGNGRCGKCKIRVDAGKVDAPGSIHMTDEEYAGGWRLACLSKIMADVTIFVPKTTASEKHRVHISDPDSEEEFDSKKKYGHHGHHHGH